MSNLLFCVGHALAKQGVGEIALAALDPTGFKVATLLGRVAADAVKEWRANKKQDKLNAEILAAAQLEFAKAKEVAAEIARQVAGENWELRDAVERYVTLVPASLRASLRRPDDLTGTSLPANFAIETADDLAMRLPHRLPRFKAGDAPDFLAGWELVEQLGAGGFGEVWRARNSEDDTLEGAVKFGHAMTDAEHALLNEGDVLNRLRGHGRHPGIVELLDRRTRGVAVPWLRYEFVPGGDLSARIVRWQALPPADRVAKAVAALRSLAETVGHFHRLPGGPVVHRDLKPSNILVTAADGLKVADFGIGAVSARRALDADRAGTASRAGRLQSYLRGSHTPLYASPQQRAGGRDIDPRDDVHALGVIGFHLLSGRLDHGTDAMLADHRWEDGLPAGLVAALKKCVRYEPADRWPDAAALADGLHEGEAVAAAGEVEVLHLMAARAKPPSRAVPVPLLTPVATPVAPYAAVPVAIHPPATPVVWPAAPPERVESRPPPTTPKPKPDDWTGILVVMAVLGVIACVVCVIIAAGSTQSHPPPTATTRAGGK